MEDEYDSIKEFDDTFKDEFLKSSTLANIEKELTQGKIISMDD